jgi:hypothetical protein
VSPRAHAFTTGGQDRVGVSTAAFSVSAMVTSSITLAKVVRDEQEITDVVSRVDRARWTSCWSSTTRSKVAAG